MYNLIIYPPPQNKLNISWKQKKNIIRLFVLSSNSSKQFGTWNSQLPINKPYPTTNPPNEAWGATNMHHFDPTVFRATLDVHLDLAND